jgi:hypothetical protein
MKNFEKYNFGADLPGIRLAEKFETLPVEVRKDEEVSAIARLFGSVRVEDLVREKSRVISSITSSVNVAAARRLFKALEVA